MLSITTLLMRTRLRKYRATIWFHKTWVYKAWRWIMCHTFERYHIINISGVAPNYKYGYIDKDEAMYYACFKCLVDFVEKERPFEVADWSIGEDRKWVGEEIKILYEWWKTGRKAELEQVYQLNNQIKRQAIDYKKWGIINNKMQDRDDEMLMRLIAIRRYLWI